MFIVLLSIGRPSTIISGWLLLLIELTPRIVIDDDAPGTPEVLVTSTPATRPCSAFTKFSRCVCAISAAGDGLLRRADRALRGGLSERRDDDRVELRGNAPQLDVDDVVGADRPLSGAVPMSRNCST